MDIHSLKEIVKPENIVKFGGDWGPFVVMAVIFAETGLLVGFFFPGDSLLFTAGLFVGMGAKGGIEFNIIGLLIGVFLAAVIGNTVGYLFGRSVGPALFKRDDSLIFKKKYLEMTRNFYEKNGRMAIILGRFLPIIRTFVPVLAGAIKLDFWRFTLYNVIGGAAWTASFILIGYFLGARFPGPIKDNLDFIVIALIVITIIPVIRTFLKERKKGKEAAAAAAANKEE
jgi:membrane-associated protein